MRGRSSDGNVPSPWRRRLNGGSGATAWANAPARAGTAASGTSPRKRRVRCPGAPSEGPRIPGSSGVGTSTATNARTTPPTTSLPMKPAVRVPAGRPGKGPDDGPMGVDPRGDEDRSDPAGPDRVPHQEQDERTGRVPLGEPASDPLRPERPGDLGLDVDVPAAEVSPPPPVPVPGEPLVQLARREGGRRSAGDPDASVREPGIEPPLPDRLHPETVAREDPGRLHEERPVLLALAGGARGRADPQGPRPGRGDPQPPFGDLQPSAPQEAGHLAVTPVPGAAHRRPGTPDRVPGERLPALLRPPHLEEDLFLLGPAERSVLHRASGHVGGRSDELTPRRLGGGGERGGGDQAGRDPRGRHEGVAGGEDRQPSPGLRVRETDPRARGPGRRRRDAEEDVGSGGPGGRGPELIGPALRVLGREQEGHAELPTLSEDLSDEPGRERMRLVEDEEALVPRGRRRPGGREVGPGGEQGRREAARLRSEDVERDPDHERPAARQPGPQLEAAVRR